MNVWGFWAISLLHLRLNIGTRCSWGDIQLVPGRWGQDCALGKLRDRQLCGDVKAQVPSSGTVWSDPHRPEEGADSAVVWFPQS